MAASDAQLLKQVAAANDKIRKASETLDAALARRRELYLEARARPEPISFRRLAEAAGTTEAAVMQVVNKGLRADLLDVITARIGDLDDHQAKRVLDALTKGRTHADALVIAQRGPVSQLRGWAA